MDIVVKGRNVEVPEHYRAHVVDKLARVKRYDHKAIRYDVELFHEPNPRQSKSCQRVEITGHCRGQTVRAEACGPDFYAALDTAVSKLENRLRRVADRRKVHHGRRPPTSGGGWGRCSCFGPPGGGPPPRGGRAPRAARGCTGRQQRR